MHAMPENMKARKKRNSKGQYCHKHGKKPSVTLKHRKYRIDKKHPQRTKIIITEDYGKIEQTQKYFMETEPKRTITLKQKNPNLLYILKSPIKIAYYKDTERCFVYTLDGEYLEELEKNDLKRLFSQIGHLLSRKKT